MINNEFANFRLNEFKFKENLGLRNLKPYVSIFSQNL